MDPFKTDWYQLPERSQCLRIRHEWLMWAYTHKKRKKYVLAKQTINL